MIKILRLLKTTLFRKISFDSQIETRTKLVLLCVSLSFFGIVFSLGVLPITLYAQFLTGKPDVMIWVMKSPVGSDYVQVRMVSEKYPSNLLKEQCEKIGEYAGVPIRGLNVEFTSTGSGVGKQIKILMARFAIDSLIDRQKGVFRILPIAKAFAGAPSPNTVHTIGVIFEGETPMKGVTVKGYENESVKIEAQYDPGVKTVEYRIFLKTQNPSKITFPETIPEAVQTKNASSPSNTGTDSSFLLWLWIGAAAILTGVLVYFALRPSRRSH